MSILEVDESLISYVKDRPGHDLKYSLNSKKLEKQLNWKRNYSFNKGIDETIRWFLKNK